MNIKLKYLYRDYSNYKQFESVIFSNHKLLDINYIKHVIVANLIDGEYFVADSWNLPNLFFIPQNEDDHGWHEFVDIEYTEEKASNVDVVSLLTIIKAAGQSSASGASK